MYTFLKVVTLFHNCEARLLISRKCVELHRPICALKSRSKPTTKLKRYILFKPEELLTVIVVQIQHCERHKQRGKKKGCLLEVGGCWKRWYLHETGEPPTHFAPHKSCFVYWELHCCAAPLHHHRRRKIIQSIKRTKLPQSKSLSISRRHRTGPAAREGGDGAHIVTEIKPATVT